MDRRKFLIGAGGAAIGGSALLGSGAFTRVESQRQVTIEVAEDPDAYLGLEGCEGSPNSSYTNIDDSGHLEVDMSPDNPTDADGQGINSDSRSYFDDVFQICNNGKQDVCVWINDDDDWPTYDDTGERRVEFYVGNSVGAGDLTGLEEQSIIGQESAVQLTTGQCVCIGIATVSKELSEEDQLLAELDNEITITADADVECEATACPELSGAYECTSYLFSQAAEEWERIGTGFAVTNLGSATTADIAVANEPGKWEDDLEISAFETTGIVSDASFPTRALLFWDPVDEECIDVVDAPTWGEYKEEEDIDDLEDWFDKFGTADPPDDIPEDPDDDLVVRVEDIPEEGVEDTVGPDESIPDDQWPDMSDPAEEEGWITCEKFDDEE